MTLSYTSAHWHDERGSGRAPNTFAVVAVAEMEDKLRTIANEYASEGNYDYARRVYRTGMEMSDIAIMATKGEVGSEKRQQKTRSVGGFSSQTLNDSRDNSDVPIDTRIEFSEAGGKMLMPKELFDIYQQVWQVFADENKIDIQVGYSVWHEGGNLR